MIDLLSVVTNGGRGSSRSDRLLAICDQHVGVELPRFAVLGFEPRVHHFPEEGAAVARRSRVRQGVDPGRILGLERDAAADAPLRFPGSSHMPCSYLSCGDKSTVL